VQITQRTVRNWLESTLVPSIYGQISLESQVANTMPQCVKQHDFRGKTTPVQ